MSQIISGTFETGETAVAAVRELAAAGVPGERISLIASEAALSRDMKIEREAEERTEIGAALGAALGGGAGLMAGLGVMAAPGVGPLVGAGWLVSALGGAVAGGYAGGSVGALASSGLTQEDARAYVEALQGGAHIVAVRASAEEQEAVEAVLTKAGAQRLPGGSARPAT